MRPGYEQGHSSPFHPQAFVGQLQKMSDVPPLPTFGGESDGSDDGSQSVGWVQHFVWNHMLDQPKNTTVPPRGGAMQDDTDVPCRPGRYLHFHGVVAT